MKKKETIVAFVRAPLARPSERLTLIARIVLQSPPAVRCVVLFSFATLFLHRALSIVLAHKKWSLAPIASLERQCPAPQYETWGTVVSKNGGGGSAVARAAAHSSAADNAATKPKICLTTLTDEKHKTLKTRLFGWRNFDGLLELTWQNKVDYAAKHGYHLFDESDQLDRSRPPSWSKIRAVTRLLKEENCTWVFWMDADAVVMNSEKRIEDFLPADHLRKDLLLSEDNGGGYNAGLWLVRNTDWALQFLQEWWDMKSFVKPTGMSKSGDNDALKHMIKQMKDFDNHILAPARCTFNSYVKVVPPARLASVTAKATEHAWYMREDVYHKSDFIAHLAGVDNKADVMKMLLKLAT